MTASEMLTLKKGDQVTVESGRVCEVTYVGPESTDIEPERDHRRFWFRQVRDGKHYGPIRNFKPGKISHHIRTGGMEWAH